MSNKRYLFRGCTVINTTGKTKRKITLYDRIYGVEIEVSMMDFYSMENETIDDFYQKKEKK